MILLKEFLADIQSEVDNYPELLDMPVIVRNYNSQGLSIVNKISEKREFENFNDVENLKVKRIKRLNYKFNALLIN